MTNKCKVEGCEKAGKLVKGLCQTHYMRLRRTGSEFIVRKSGSAGEGRRKHPMYGAYSQMINRCYNRNNSSYARYGALGISVCQRWKDDFLNFLADMGERPEGMTLDRIDGLGNYEPSNCRWATNSTQRANRTEEGDRKMREGISRGVKMRWEKWRADGSPRLQRSPEHCANLSAALKNSRKAAKSLDFDE